MKENVCKYPAIDAHLDLGLYLRRERQKGRRQVLLEDYLSDMRAGNVKAVVSAIFVDEQSEWGSALQQACDQVVALQTEVKEATDFFRICTNSAEIEAAYACGKIALLLSFEGIEPLEGNPELLDFFYNAGVRGMGLAHTRRNKACDGANYTDSAYNLGCGLTDFGIELIRRAQKLHMMIDVSHLNDAGIDDVLAITKGPVVASHSNCRAINPTRRNLTDEQICAIADRGGVIGINGCSAIISDKPCGDMLEAMLRHVDHLVKVGGTDCVGLGFDIAEMILPDGHICVNGNDILVRDAVPGYSALEGLADRLKGRGYSENAIEKIFHGNFSRVFHDVLV